MVDTLDGDTLPGFCQDMFWKFFHNVWMKDHEITEDTIADNSIAAAQKYADELP